MSQVTALLLSILITLFGCLWLLAFIANRIVDISRRLDQPFETKPRQITAEKVYDTTEKR